MAKEKLKVGAARGEESWRRVLGPTAFSLAGTEATSSLFLPQNIWGCIRQTDPVKKIVMEICNRETLSKASLKSLLNPQPGGGNWKLENWETITGPSKWPKFNPICTFKDG